jgi:hypothetical protein
MENTLETNIDETLETRLDKGLVLTDRFRNTLSLDEETSAYALNAIAKHMGRIGTKTVQQVYDQGISVDFRGGAPSRSEDTYQENYVLFYPSEIKRDPDRPVKLRVQCYFGELDHKDVINDEEDVIVAGDLINSRFNSFTTTWMGENKREIPKFKFGAAVNEFMLNHFQLD